MNPLAPSTRRTLLALLLALGAVACSPVERTATELPSLRTVAPESVGLSSSKLGAVEQGLAELVDARRIAGGVVLVARRGGTALLAAVGWQDVEARVPMRPDTLFRICSMTKPVTSVGILILEEEGKLSLSDPVSRYVPAFKDPVVAIAHGEGGEKDYELVPAEREITIRDLLVHTSGLTYRFWGREYFSKLYEMAGVSDGLVETEGTMGDNVRRLAAMPLMFQPGTAWEYGLSTDVLGHVIEMVTGQTLDAFLRERIFEPLKMNDTAFLVPEAKRSRLAGVYQPTDDKTIEPLPEGVVRTGDAVYSASYPLQESTRFFSGGAGLVSTARDYGRFLQMLLDGGELDGARVLKPQTVARMTSIQTGALELHIQSHGNRFGLGVGIVSEEARDTGLGSVGTFSWGGFYHTYFFVDPQEELVGVVMTQLYPWDHLGMIPDFRHAVYDAIVD